MASMLREFEIRPKHDLAAEPDCQKQEREGLSAFAV